MASLMKSISSRRPSAMRRSRTAGACAPIKHGGPAALGLSLTVFGFAGCVGMLSGWSDFDSDDADASPPIIRDLDGSTQADRGTVNDHEPDTSDEVVPDGDMLVDAVVDQITEANACANACSHTNDSCVEPVEVLDQGAKRCGCLPRLQGNKMPCAGFRDGSQMVTTMDIDRFSLVGPTVCLRDHSSVSAVPFAHMTTRTADYQEGFHCTEDMPADKACGAAVWRPSVPRAGRYEIYVYIPPPQRTTQAQYRTRVPRAWEKFAYVDQSQVRNEHVLVGTYRLEKGNQMLVEISRKPGEPMSTEVVASYLFVRPHSDAAARPPSLADESVMFCSQNFGGGLWECSGLFVTAFGECGHGWWNVLRTGNAANYYYTTTFADKASTTWDYTAEQSGEYDVYAWIPERRATQNAQYRVYPAADSPANNFRVARVNQQGHGWKKLGNDFVLAPGARVELDNQTSAGEPQDNSEVVYSTIYIRPVSP